MATIRLRGGRWEAQVRRVGWPTLTKHFTRKREAQTWAASKEAELARGLIGTDRRNETTALAVLLTRYMEQVSPNKKGSGVELARLKALHRSKLAKISLDRLTPEVLARWRDERLAQVSGSTVNRELNLLSAVLNTARKDWGYGFPNPIEGIRRPRENRARRRRLSQEEQAALFRELGLSERLPDGRYRPGGSRNPWALPFVELALATAMRRSELLRLRWEDVFLEHRFVRLHDSKNGESRDVPLSSHAIQVLKRLQGLAVDERVFPITVDAIKQVFERAVVRAGIGDLRMHDLRHGFYPVSTDGLVKSLKA